MLKERTLMWCLEVPADSFVCSVSLSHDVFVSIPAAFPLDGSVFQPLNAVIRAHTLSCFYSQEALFPKICKLLLSDTSCLIQVAMKPLNALSRLRSLSQTNGYNYCSFNVTKRGNTEDWHSEGIKLKPHSGPDCAKQVCNCSSRYLEENTADVP